MPVYHRRTGRTRTVQATGNFILPSRGRSHSQFVHDFKTLSGLRFSCLGFRVTGDTTGVTDSIIAPVMVPRLVPANGCPNPDYDYFGRCYFAVVGYGELQSTDFDIAQTGAARCEPTADPIDADLALTGSYVFEVDAEEWQSVWCTTPDEINPATSEPWDAARGYPKYLFHPNGEYPEKPLIDGASTYTPYCELTYYEVAMPGGTFTGEVTINGHTVTVSGTLDDSRPILDYAMAGWISVANSGYEEDASLPTASVTLSAYCAGLAVDFSSPSPIVDNLTTYVRGDASGGFVARGKGIAKSALSSITGPVEREVQFSGAPPAQYDVDLRLVNGWGEPITEHLLVHGTWNTPEQVNPPDSYPLEYLYKTIETSGGALRRDVDLPMIGILVYDGLFHDGAGYYWYFDYGGGGYQTYEFARAWQIGIGMGFDAPELNTAYSVPTPGDMANRQLDLNAWPILIEDPLRHSGFTLTHTAFYEQDAMNSTDDWTATNGSVSVVGGNLTLTASGGSGSMSKAVGWNWRNYRDAEITLSCDQDCTVTMVVSYVLDDGAGGVTKTKRYDIDATGSLTAHRVQLTAPSNATMDTDQTDDSTLHDAPPGYRPETDNVPDEAIGHLYGVGFVSAIGFEGVPDTKILTISSLTLARATDTLAALLTHHHTHQTSDEWSLGNSKYRQEGKRFGAIYADRKQGTEFAYAEYGGGYLNTDLPTVHDMLARYSDVVASGGAPGLSVTTETTTDSHTPIAGETAFWDTTDYLAAWLITTPTAANRSLLVDRDLRSGLAVKLCIHAHSVKAYPGCGDPETGVYEIRFPIRSTWAAPGSIAEGVAQKTGTLEALPSAIVRVYDDGALKETLQADAKGFWRSRGLLRSAGDDYAILTDDATLAMPVAARRYRTQRLVGPAPPSDLAIGAVECASARAWTHVAVGKRIRAYQTTPALLLRFESGEHAVTEWARLREDPRSARLYGLAVKTGSTWGVYVSEDGGQTIEEILTMTANSGVIEVDSERGALILLYGDGSDLVWRRVLSGGSWSSAASVLYGGSQLDATLLDAAQDPRVNGRGFLLASVTGGSTIVAKSDDMFETLTLEVTL